MTGLPGGGGTAAEQWRRELQGWVIPQDLLDSAPESPYGWPAALWRRRAETALVNDSRSPTIDRAAALAGPNGSVLDIGAGTGRSSLPLAKAGHPVTALEPNRSMLDGLEVTTAGLPYTIIEGRWPDSLTMVGRHDVVMASHVVYDVADIGPFVGAMDSVAGNGVVIELTDRHPWVHLAPYYRALHGLERPDGPRWEDLAEVVSETTGRTPSVEVWSRPSDLWFESQHEILEFYGRRLLIGPDRWPELEQLLEPAIVAGPTGLQVGEFQVGGDNRDLVTIWWGHP